MISLILPCRGGCAAHGYPLIILLVPGTSLADWRSADAPFLHRIMAQGALAVMNTRTARTASDHVRETPESAVLTLGCGSRAAGSAETAHFLPPSTRLLPLDVTAADLYRRNMGQTPPAGAWVDPQWPQILRSNTERGYDIHLGNLGDALSQSGIAFAASPTGFAPLLACRPDGTAPVSSFPATKSRSGACVIIDAGNDLHLADKLVASAMARTAAVRGRLIIVSPFVSDKAYALGQRLAPIACWGWDVPAGMLYSSSTRRLGLVTNTDFAPTIAATFGTTLPSPAFGRPWQMRAASNAGARVAAVETQSYRQAKAMRILPFLAIVLGLFLACATGLRRIGRNMSLLAVFPLAWIWAALLAASIPQCVTLLVAISLLTSLLARHLALGSIVRLMTGGLVVLLTGDMLGGDPLMHQALLGYSAVEGARFYGIGNEAMGVLVGAALVFTTGIWKASPPRGHIIIGIGLTVLAALLISPAAGAKAGGILVAVPSFGVLLWRLYGQSMNGKIRLFLLLLTIFVIIAVVSADLHHSGAQSHVGQAIVRIGHGGFSEAQDLITRKAAVEAHLMTHSTWIIPLWAGIFGLWAYQRRGHHPVALTALLDAGATALVTCLLFNDAGVVAASLCTAVVWSGLRIEEKSPSSEIISEEGPR